LCRNVISICAGHMMIRENERGSNRLCLSYGVLGIARFHDLIGLFRECDFDELEWCNC